MKPVINFLITSHTGGEKTRLKEKILCGLVESIRQHFSAFIVVSSASNIPIEAKISADASHEEAQKNGYHGNQERDLLIRGLEILAENDKSYHFRIGYDFVIDSTNIESIIKMAAHFDKKFVCAMDDGDRAGIRSNIWFAETNFTLNLLRGLDIKGHSETSIFNELNKKPEVVYFYPSIREMWNNCENTFDLIGHAGTSFRESKINYFLKKDERT